ncbi:hypothetical protein BABINDRAFT_162959 [Babjeviella inositovora NRRL Y-12698]|uniref:AMP-dependent synthetase/ligase domain-containing protein n=1 Tax=Babjeviella inositovora NRRL Y-12698 TaxID=984486 RepID=A0A1E3QKT8_9ASCO|nr:uncharacterized protein BABINDRAFT_162959 [Babjeviella inositovora NRRL Y-12698]ODQ78316.1 hypothetical protein BABINDRAFT_162959 [Babjeviella inositovora NRRL Y-12698]
MPTSLRDHLPFNDFAPLTTDVTDAAIRRLFEEQLPLSHQLIGKAQPVPNSKKAGFSPVYRNSNTPHAIYNTINSGIHTFYDMWNNSVKLWPNKRCLGQRVFNDGTKQFSNDFTWKTFSEINAIKTDVGSGFRHVIENNPYRMPKHDTLSQYVISIYSGNRPEWVITDIACTSYDLGTTCLYDVLGKDSSMYILNLTESPVVACAADKVEQIIQTKRDNPEALELLITIICFDSLKVLPPRLLEEAKKQKITLYDFDQIIEIGKRNRIPEIPPTPDSIFTISFTLGTTGKHPKGVSLIHSNFVALISFCLSHIQRPPNSTNYCFLPLAHLFERITTTFCLAGGVPVGFPSRHELEYDVGLYKRGVRDPLYDLIADLKVLKPTFLTSVPRMFSKIEGHIKNYIASMPEARKAKFESAISRRIQLQAQYDGATGEDPETQQYIDEIRSLVGFDNMHTCMTGGAPIAGESIINLKAALGTGFAQVYGSTEVTSTPCAANPYEKEPGTSGPIGMFGELKLRDIPEMAYRTENVDAKGYISGEVMLRGPLVFSGYYKNEEETRKSIDDEGWFLTGDVGKLNVNTGRIYIVDRVKNVFKLAQGEYIAPDRLEGNFIGSNPEIAQLYIHGDSLQTYLVAIVGLNPEAIPKWLEDNYQIKTTSEEEILKIFERRDVRAKLCKLFNDRVVEQYGIQGFEKIYNIHCEFNPLTVERQVITPTFKMKRPMCAQFFKSDTDRMYQEGKILDAKAKL